MLNFKEWFLKETIGFPRNCGEFKNMNKPFFLGAGSDLGCHKVKKKKKCNEELMGNPGTMFPDKSRPKRDGLNKGCGGYAGPCPPAPNPINNKLDNSGCGGSSGKQPCGLIKFDMSMKGCGGGAGPCPPVKPGCSGAPCPSSAASQSNPQQPAQPNQAAPNTQKDANKK